MLKTFLYIFGGIIALVLTIPLFVDGDMSCEQVVTINKPRTEVFNYVVQLKNQDNFSVWAQMDPNIKKSYTGEDGQVGFVSHWESADENVGTGEQEIKAIVPEERIDYELRFIEPMESTAPAYMTTEAVNDSVTLVKWGFKSKIPYPFNIICLFSDPKAMLEKDFQQGLDNLKNIMEKN